MCDFHGTWNLMFCDDCGIWYLPVQEFLGRQPDNYRECPRCKGTKTLTHKEFHKLDECGCCGGAHLPEFHSDCRNNAQRFLG